MIFCKKYMMSTIEKGKNSTKLIKKEVMNVRR